MTEHIELEEEEFDARFSGQTIRRLIGLLRPYTLWVIGFLATVMMVSGLDSYFTYLSARMVDEGIIAKNWELLVQIVEQYAGLVLIQAVAVFGFIWLAGLLGERIRYDLRQKLFNHLQQLSLTYYNRMPVGWIISRVTSDTDRVAELVTWGLLDVTWSSFNIITALFFMSRISWQLTLIVMVIVPIIIVVATLFQRKIIVQYREVRKVNSKITGAYNETITGVRVIKALDREEANLREFGKLTGEMYRAGYRAAWYSALFLPTVQLISSFAIASIVTYAGVTASSDGLSVGGMYAFISYVLFMIWPVQEMARVFAEMQQAVASGERIFSLLDATPDIVDKPNAYEVEHLRGDIVFDKVDFQYEEGKPILTGFDLHVKHGETIALVGPTGGGKSTIVNLLCRFFEPTGGRIQLSGHDYTDLTQHTIQSKVGMVLQTPHLFSGTIRENIRYGRLDASDAEVEDAAKLAGAHSFIEALEKGYEEQVGEGGVLLSTGQKQLLSLARAVLARPDIFIMDEATASVDTLTEAMIQQGMDTLMKECTSFVIAHRLSTIRNATRILVIEDGRIKEMGTHRELLKVKGHYYRLYTQQFRQELVSQVDELAAMLEEPVEAEPAAADGQSNGKVKADLAFAD
ncbi:MAG: ABC transporter ATP-binding protein [Caldilinea sp.]|nr:ABC transporter ATP-binding protein [Caldilineaceae bacterium]MCW5840776.1 ABC transporter ATP-binding protein [Caldilinea sp.]